MLKNKKCLFIGKTNCKYTLNCVKFLKQFKIKLKIILCSGRNTKIPRSLKNWNGDFIFSYKNYWLIPKKILDSAKIAAINFHPASPEYPGSGSYNWALYNNAKYFGITVHIMNEKFDNGKIIFFFKFKIKKNISINSLINQTNKYSVNVFKDTFKKFNRMSDVQFKKLLKKKSEFKWVGRANSISDLDKMRFIKKDITTKELYKRIDCFHSNDFPLCLIYKKRKLFFSEN
jgi:methionyl-tRNA formyltransferase